MIEKNNEEIYEEEIDLRELFMALWKKKVMIISITLIFAIIAGAFSKVILKPVYETNLNIVISMPETYMTRYGEYKLPIAVNDEYINFIKSNNVIKNTLKDMKYKANKVTVQNLKDRVTIGEITSTVDRVQNSFHVTVSAGSANESLELAEYLYNNYIKFMDAMMKERAVSYYYNDFSVKIKTAETLLATTKDVLSKNEALLAETPETINQVDAMKEIKGASDYVVLENIINPNYTALEGVILENKKLIITTESSITEYNANLKELSAEKAAIEAYKETGDTKNLESSVLNIVDVNIYQPSEPVAPDHKSGPNTLRNVVIAGLLGGVLSVMGALFMAYWKKEI